MTGDKATSFPALSLSRRVCHIVEVLVLSLYVYLSLDVVEEKSDFATSRFKRWNERGDI